MANTKFWRGKEEREKKKPNVPPVLALVRLAVHEDRTQVMPHGSGRHPGSGVQG